MYLFQIVRQRSRIYGLTTPSYPPRSKLSAARLKTYLRAWPAWHVSSRHWSPTVKSTRIPSTDWSQISGLFLKWPLQVRIWPHQAQERGWWSPAIRMVMELLNGHMTIPILWWLKLRRLIWKLAAKHEPLLQKVFSSKYVIKKR